MMIIKSTANYQIRSVTVYSSIIAHLLCPAVCELSMYSSKLIKKQVPLSGHFQTLTVQPDPCPGNQTARQFSGCERACENRKP